MAEPALKIVTEFVRIAVTDLDMKWGPSAEEALGMMGLDFADLHNALSCCEVQRSNKSDAEGVVLEVVGTTTEDVELTVKVWVNWDQGFYRIEGVAWRRSSGDEKSMHDTKSGSGNAR